MLSTRASASRPGSSILSLSPSENRAASAVDGFEYLAPDDLEALTPRDLAELMAAEPESASPSACAQAAAPGRSPAARAEASASSAPSASGSAPETASASWAESSRRSRAVSSAAASGAQSARAWPAAARSPSCRRGSRYAPCPPSVRSRLMTMPRASTPGSAEAEAAGSAVTGAAASPPSRGRRPR